MKCGDQNIWVSNHYHKLFERRGLSYSPSFLIHWNCLVNVCYMEKEIDRWITTKALRKSCLTSFLFFFFFFWQNSSVSNILLWTLKIFSENSWRILVEIYENYKLFLFRRIRKKESKVEQRKEIFKQGSR